MIRREIAPRRGSAGRNTERRSFKRWGSPCGRTLSRWKSPEFRGKLAIFGLACALLGLGTNSSSAATIFSFAGTYSGATGTGSPGTSVTFNSGTALSDSSSALTSYTANPLALNLAGYSTVTNTGVTFPGTFTISDTIGDSATFALANSTAEILPQSTAFGPFTFFYGLVQADLTLVNVTDPNDPNLGSELSAFGAHGGVLFVTYNGINFVTGGATVQTSPSESFTVIANNAPNTPEPTTAVLTLTGGVVIALSTLARQLRRRKKSKDLSDS
jgi:hypothetical protein